MVLLKGEVMGPAESTVALQVLFVGLAFGWRTLRQYRRTGSTGFVAQRERGALARVAGLALLAGVLALGAGTALTARGDAELWTVAAALGMTAMLTGLVVTLAAQMQMGASWRIGVDPDERTELVTAGVFSRVRNPIFSGMILFGAGSAVAVPQVTVVLGAVLLTIGIVVQVLAVEEPYLRRVQGESYASYLVRSGRFLPRLRASVPAALPAGTARP